MGSVEPEGCCGEGEGAGRVWGGEVEEEGRAGAGGGPGGGRVGGDAADGEGGGDEDRCVGGGDVGEEACWGCTGGAEGDGAEAAVGDEFLEDAARRGAEVRLEFAELG